jgi:hypothetical protein
MNSTNNPANSYRILMRRLLFSAISGVVIGSFLIFVATGAFQIGITVIALLTVFALPGVVMFLIAESKREGNDAGLKGVFDYLSILSISLFFCCPWWLYIESVVGSRRNGWPIPLIVFAADGIPFLIGLIWLGARFANSGSVFFRRSTVWLVALTFIFIPLILLKRLEG